MQYRYKRKYSFRLVQQFSLAEVQLNTWVNSEPKQQAPKKSPQISRFQDLFITLSTKKYVI